MPSRSGTPEPRGPPSGPPSGPSTGAPTPRVNFVYKERKACTNCYERKIKCVTSAAASGSTIPRCDYCTTKDLPCTVLPRKKRVVKKKTPHPPPKTHRYLFYHSSAIISQKTFQTFAENDLKRIYLVGEDGVCFPTAGGPPIDPEGKPPDHTVLFERPGTTDPVDYPPQVAQWMDQYGEEVIYAYFRVAFRRVPVVHEQIFRARYAAKGLSVQILLAAFAQGALVCEHWNPKLRKQLSHTFASFLDTKFPWHVGHPNLVTLLGLLIMCFAYSGRAILTRLYIVVYYAQELRIGLALPPENNMEARFRVQRSLIIWCTHSISMIATVRCTVGKPMTYRDIEVAVPTASEVLLCYSKTPETASPDDWDHAMGLVMRIEATRVLEDIIDQVYLRRVFNELEKKPLMLAELLDTLEARLNSARAAAQFHTAYHSHMADFFIAALRAILYSRTLPGSPSRKEPLPQFAPKSMIVLENCVDCCKRVIEYRSPSFWYPHVADLMSLLIFLVMEAYISAPQREDSVRLLGKLVYLLNNVPEWVEDSTWSLVDSFKVIISNIFRKNGLLKIGGPSGGGNPGGSGSGRDSEDAARSGGPAGPAGPGNTTTTGPGTADPGTDGFAAGTSGGSAGSAGSAARTAGLSAAMGQEVPVPVEVRHEPANFTSSYLQTVVDKQEPYMGDSIDYSNLLNGSDIISTWSLPGPKSDSSFDNGFSPGIGGSYSFVDNDLYVSDSFLEDLKRI